MPALALLALATTAAAATPERPPNVILVVIDTLRADRVHGNYALLRQLTPFLNEVAARGATFTEAYASSSWTCPSVASLLTSRYPLQHRVGNFDSVLDASEVTLAESLAPLGYRAAGFTANFRLTADLGYAQGFAYWDAIVPPKPQISAKPRGNRVREDAAGWLSANPEFGTKRPLFLYLHYLEPHAPYQPPEPFHSRLVPAGTTPERIAELNARATAPGHGRKGLLHADLALLGRLYDGEVASADAEVRRTFDMLTAAGVLDHAVVVITADHGEEFGEHGELLHGNTLYNDAIRVPLIITGPGIAPGQVIATPVSLLDVAPTILALAGAAPERRHEGRSLLPLLRPAAPPDGGPPPRPMLSELLPLDSAAADRRRLHRTALIEGKRKGILGAQGAVEIYDLAADPREQRPLPLVAVESLELSGALAELESALNEVAPAVGLARPIDDATKEKLRLLGYQF